LRISLDFAQNTTATHQKEDFMKMYSRLFAPDLTHQLEAAGILTGDAQDAAITHPAPPWLKISQEGGPFENSIFDLDCGGGTGCMLDLHVAVDRQLFPIWRWLLDLPRKGPKFQWLPEPPGGKFPDNMYKFPGREALMYPRDQVINHLSLVKRGYNLNGLLLGYSFESIPDSYRNGANIDASLVLVDEMGRGFSTAVQLCVNRMAKIDRKRAKPKTRRPIFENQYCAEDELVQK
jgi:hypothetical protein